MDDNKNAFYVRSGSKITGPFTFAQLQNLASRRIVVPVDEISPDRARWTPALRIPNLFPAGLASPINPGSPAGDAAPNAVLNSAPVSPARPEAQPQREVPATSALLPSVLTVGRDAALCDIVVDSLAISRRHLALHKTAGGVTAADLGSSGGTFVNGTRLTAPRRLASGDSISLGGVQLVFDGSTLIRRPAHVGYEISVQGLGREVIDRGTGLRRMLIREVTMTLRPAEFIALVGASGAGKSTLFGALSGRVRGTHGRVRYDGEDLYSNFEGLRASIGYVPQRDVFHDVLPVGSALRATSRLRLSKDTSDSEISANIDRVLKIVSLSEKRDTIISNLSGGEQKRVAIALELLSRPRALFLDEPTAPLDPRTTVQMMQLFRGLADSGITVVMITHAANSLTFCDVVAYMHKGLLTFQGQPDRLKEFFGVADMGDAYAKEEQRSPEEWQSQFNASESCRQFVAARAAHSQTNTVDPASDASVADAARRRGGGNDWSGLWHQIRVLTARYLRVVTIDRANFAVLLLLAPVVAALLCLVASSIDTSRKSAPDWYQNYYAKQKILCFGSVMIVMFLALFASVREIVKELPVYLHEHFVNVEIVPYLLSKFAILLSVNAVQTALVVAVVTFYGKIEAGDLPLFYGILFTCAAVGTALGLMISALVTQSDQAVTGMIVIVIPEILFSGALLPVKGISKYLAGPFITAFWGLNALMSQVPPAPPEVARLGEQFRQQYTGPGTSSLIMLGQFVAAVGIIYWMMVRKDGPRAAERIAAKLQKALVGRKRKHRA